MDKENYFEKLCCVRYDQIDVEKQKKNSSTKGWYSIQGSQSFQFNV